MRAVLRFTWLSAVFFVKRGKRPAKQEPVFAWHDTQRR